MWTCPKCGRSFAKQDQHHFCAAKPKTVDEYIARQDEEKRPDLTRVRSALRKVLPDAEERISWSMPTYWQGHNIIHFAAGKKHIGLYPGPEAVAAFSTELEPYSTDKGTVRIPYGKVDEALISRIAIWSAETAHHA